MKEKILLYLENVSDQDCIDLLREIISRDVARTKELVDMGIDPLCKDSPYVPHFAGRLYLEGGEEALEEKIKLNICGARKMLAIMINAQEEVMDLFDNPTHSEILKEDIFAMLEIADIKRKSFKIVGED